MNKKNDRQTEATLWLADEPVSTADILDILLAKNLLPTLVSELTIDKAVKDIVLAKDEEEKLMNLFRDQHGLQEEKQFQEYLKTNKLTIKFLTKQLARPHKIVKYREERWGARTNSLYLKNKSKYDLITYKRLESTDNDLIQEYYFRLKEGEETWEDLAKRIPGKNQEIKATIGPIAVENIEEPLLEAMKKAGTGNIIRPMSMTYFENNKATKALRVIAMLEHLETNPLNDELRTRILRDEFDEWLKEETTTLLRKLTIEK
jgi:hypothetical protein